MLRAMAAPPDATPYGELAKSSIYQGAENFVRGVAGADPYVPPADPAAPSPSGVVPTMKGRGLPATGLPAMNANAAANTPAPVSRGPSFGPLSIMQLQALSGFLPRQPTPQEFAQRQILDTLNMQRDQALKEAGNDPNKVRDILARHDQELYKTFLSPQLGLLGGLEQMNQTGYGMTQ